MQSPGELWTSESIAVAGVRLIVLTQKLQPAAHDMHLVQRLLQVFTLGRSNAGPGNSLAAPTVLAWAVKR